MEDTTQTKTSVFSYFCKYDTEEDDDYSDSSSCCSNAEHSALELENILKDKLGSPIKPKVSICDSLKLSGHLSIKQWSNIWDNYPGIQIPYKIWDELCPRIAGIPSWGNSYVQSVEYAKDLILIERAMLEKERQLKMEHERFENYCSKEDKVRLVLVPKSSSGEYLVVQTMAPYRHIVEEHGCIWGFLKFSIPSLKSIEIKRAYSEAVKQRGFPASEARKLDRIDFYKMLETYNKYLESDGEKEFPYTGKDIRVLKHKKDEILIVMFLNVPDNFKFGRDRPIFPDPSVPNPKSLCIDSRWVNFEVVKNTNQVSTRPLLQKRNKSQRTVINGITVNIVNSFKLANNIERSYPVRDFGGFQNQSNRGDMKGRGRGRSRGRGRGSSAFGSINDRGGTFQVWHDK